MIDLADTGYRHTDDEDDDFDLLEITKEYLLKEYKINGMMFKESIYQNLKKAGFNTLYDIIENLENALKVVDTDEDEVFYFSRTVCICCRGYGLLPKDIDYLYHPTLTEDVINKIREAIEKDKLETLSIVENYDITDIDTVEGRYKCTKEYSLKLWKISYGTFTENIDQKLTEAGFDTLYDIIQDPENTLKAIATADEEEISEFYRIFCKQLEIYRFFPKGFDYKLAFEKDIINRIKDDIEKDKLEILSEDDNGDGD